MVQGLPRDLGREFGDSSSCLSSFHDQSPLSLHLTPFPETVDFPNFVLWFFRLETLGFSVRVLATLHGSDCGLLREGYGGEAWGDEVEEERREMEGGRNLLTTSLSFDSLPDWPVFILS